MVGGQVQVLRHQLEGPCEEGFSSFFFSLHASSLASSFLFCEGDLAFFLELVSLRTWAVRTRVLEPFVDSWERETFPPSFINSVYRSRSLVMSGEVDFPAIFMSEHDSTS